MSEWTLHSAGAVMLFLQRCLQKSIQNPLPLLAHGVLRNRSISRQHVTEVALA